MELFLKVLMIEDNLMDVDIFLSYLQESKSPQYKFDHAVSIKQGLEFYEKTKYDIIILDMFLPDGEKIEAFKRVKEKIKDVPIIIATGSYDKEMALNLVKEGAQDYIIKNSLNTEILNKSIVFAIERFKFVKQLLNLGQVKDELISLLSHDLRNPLGYIAMMTEEIIEENFLNLSQEIIDQISKFNKQANFGLTLLNDFLEFGRLEKLGALNYDEFYFHDLVYDSITSLLPKSKAKKIKVEYEATSAYSVYGDRPKLSRVLNNLIGNAVKYIQEGGVITVTAKEKFKEKSDIPSAIIFCIKDNGPGIGNELINKIFDQYVVGNSSALKESFGLGLTICKKIISLHHGKIWVESEVGKGSSFFVEIPCKNF